MKNKILSSIAVAVLSTSVMAHASIIDLGQAIGSPADPVSQLGRLNTQIGIYNSVNNPDLPSATMTGAATGLATGSGVTSISVDLTGWNYLVLKWADIDQFYYVGGESGSIVFNSTAFNNNDKPQGLSGYSLFNPSAVPDAGSTIALMSLALSGLGMLARRKN